MKILTSMTTTTFLIITILIINLFATLTSIYLNIIYPRAVKVAQVEPEKCEPLVIITEKTKVVKKPTEVENTPPAPPSAPYQQLILRASQKHRLDPALIRAVIMAESNYNHKAVSNKGAQGLMQLMPRTAAELGVKDSFDPAQNINGGAKYLRKLMDRFDNNVQLALAAYNAGSRYVRKYNGVPPFRATRLYIEKVFKYRMLYRQKLTNKNPMV